MQHLFAGQQQYPGDWSQGHHQQQQHHHVAQQQQHGQLHAQQQHGQMQAQAAAVAAAAAQQQHYNRIAGSNGAALPNNNNNNNMVPRGPANDVQANSDIGMTEENKRVLDWIAQLMKPSTRESALLELSKKREQVPELALILWHSFGKQV